MVNYRARTTALIMATINGISYTARECYVYEKAIRALRKHVCSTLSNAWIEYVVVHSMLSYEDAYKFYDICYSLHHEFTRKSAKELSALVIDLANCGYGSRILEVIALALRKEAENVQ